MSMSTSIVGFRPPDEKFKKYETVWHSCMTAGIPVPQEVGDFFDWSEPDQHGVRVDLDKYGCVEEWGNDNAEGMEINIKKLPKDVTVIRFYNSW